MSLRLAMNGMQTAHVRRYEVPIQKPSVAVPCRSLMMVPIVVTTMVASKAIIREVMDIVSIMASSWIVGFHSGSGVIAFSSSFIAGNGGLVLPKVEPEYLGFSSEKDMMEACARVYDGGRISQCQHD